MRRKPLLMSPIAGILVALAACVEVPGALLPSLGDAAAGGVGGMGGDSDGGGGAGGSGGTGPLPVCGPDTPDPCAKLVGLEAGGTFTCATFDDDTVRCWGANDAGQLGIEARPSTPSELPTISDLEPYEQMVLGSSHGCGLRDGKVSCWGDNGTNQLGAPGPSSPTPREVTVADVSQLRVDRSGACVLHGQPAMVSCWGMALNGQPWLESGVFPYGEPTAIAGLGSLDIVDISLGRSHACALTGDGDVWCWGNGAAGRLGDGEDSDATTPVLVSPDYPRPATAMHGAADHTCVITGDGDVPHCWGSLDLWFERSTPHILYFWDGLGVVQIASGHRMICARYEVGAVRCAGDNQFGQQPLLPSTAAQTTTLTLIPDIGDATHLAVGIHHVCVARSDGSVWCWGRNHVGQLGRGFDSEGESTPAPVLFP